MAIKFTCECGRVMQARPEYAGSPVRCPQCGSTVKVPKPGDTKVVRPLTPLLEDDQGDRQRREYKVVTQRDSLFGGRFDPEKLEHVLNAYAKKGWVVRAVTKASVWGLTVHRDEAMVILERDHNETTADPSW